jgi:hypothetical protein
MATKVCPRSLEILTRFLFVTVILVVLANVAGAYTLVCRDGHRIEVPAVFEVGKMTVTYELAPGNQQDIAVGSDRYSGNGTGQP